MPVCPFCHQEIDEHLAVHGGTCPSCFAEIPGEEAPTDPGDQVKARQQVEDARHVQRSRIPLVLVLLFLVSLVGGATWIALRPEPPMPVLDFDELGYPEIEIVAAPEDAPEPVPDAAPAPRRRQPQGERQTGLDRLLGEEGPNLDGVAIAEAGAATGTRGTRDVGDAGGDIVPDQISLRGPSFGLSTDDAAVMSVQRRRMRGETLTDDSVIIEMVRGVLDAETPRLQTCYQRSLRTREDLGGSWVLEFVLNTEGQATNITVTGQEMADEEMERCIAQKVQDWFFQPIKADLPVRKTLRFRAR